MDSTTYDVTVKSSSLTSPMANIILDICATRGHMEVPESVNEIEESNFEYQVTFKENESLHVSGYNVAVGHRSDLTEALSDLIKTMDDDAEVEVIEYSESASSGDTMMDTIINGQVNTWIECTNDGVPVVTIYELMRHLNDGDLEDFVRSIDAQIMK